MKLAFNIRSLIIKRRYCAALQRLPKTMYELASKSRYPYAGNYPFSLILSSNTARRYIYDDKEVDHTEDIDSEIEQYEEIYHHESARNMLYPNSTDPLIVKVNKCASIQAVLSFVEEHEKELQGAHVTQAVLVLWDLQKVFNHFGFLNSSTEIDISKVVNENYVTKLSRTREFNKILNFFHARLDELDVKQISFSLLYLNKMGFSTKHQTLQLLTECFKDKLSNGEYCLLSLASFLTCMSSAKDLSFYYNVLDAIPLVFKEIEKCETPEEFRQTTICLSNISQLVTDDVLVIYKNKASSFISNGKIKSEEYTTVLKIVFFLNHPQWRSKNASVICDYILLLKNHLHLLNVHELLMISQVLNQNEEPSEVLNEVQHYTTKFLVQLEEDMGPLNVRLKLLSNIVCFSPPLQRAHFEKSIRKYIDYNLDGSLLLDLQKIILFNKSSDVLIHQMFWKKVLASLENRTFRDMNLWKICYCYLTFNQNGNVHRHSGFEMQVLEWLEFELLEGFSRFFPSRLSMTISFTLTYSRSEQLLKLCIKKIRECVGQLNYIDCYNISRSLQTATKIVKNDVLKPNQIDEIKTLLDRYTYRYLSKSVDLTARNVLFKGYIYRGSTDKKLLQELIDGYTVFENLSSKLIKNMCFCMLSTQTLIPDAIDKMVNYVIEHRQNIFASNAERIIYLCYYLGYLPKNSSQFFETVINIILGNQERLSGLSNLQCCLSLSYFHALPHSFIKQIFNVKFLDKLDEELKNCYFKDTYPLRVGRSMMHLNRTVCLDYPESDVPWFHQKYIDGIKKKYLGYSNREFYHVNNIRHYLLKISNNEQYITQNETTPYGYHTDFVIHLDNNNEITSPESATQKVAILVIRPSAYTNATVQLKGQNQLKIRHLEILGYKVVLVNLTKWQSLIYGEDKTQYLNNLIWSNVPQSDVVNR